MREKPSSGTNRPTSNSKSAKGKHLSFFKKKKLTFTSYIGMDDKQVRPVVIDKIVKIGHDIKIFPGDLRLPEFPLYRVKQVVLEKDNKTEEHLVEAERRSKRKPSAQVYAALKNVPVSDQSYTDLIDKLGSALRANGLGKYMSPRNG